MIECVAIGVGVAILGWWLWRSIGNEAEGACCPMAHVHGSIALELEGISAFGDVIECCKYCKTRSVYVGANGNKITRLRFTASEWRELRGKIPTEGFRAAHNVTKRARASRWSSRWR
jgi:hypothetical protein